MHIKSEPCFHLFSWDWWLQLETGVGCVRENRKLMTNVWNIPCQSVSADSRERSQHRHVNTTSTEIWYPGPGLGRLLRNLISWDQLYPDIHPISHDRSLIPDSTDLNTLVSMINGYLSAVIDDYKSSSIWKAKSYLFPNNSLVKPSHVIYSSLARLQ